MNIKRYIAGLLLVCFSVFLGHNLVPHHHHSEVFPSPVATDCPFEHGDHLGHDQNSDADINPDEHPAHCHAFNDVVFEKYSAPLIKPLYGFKQIILLSCHTMVPEVAVGLTSSPNINLKLPCRSHTDIGTRALRAPPAFV